MSKTRTSRRQHSSSQPWRSHSGDSVRGKSSRFGFRRSDSVQEESEKHPSVYSVPPQPYSVPPRLPSHPFSAPTQLHSQPYSVPTQFHSVPIQPYSVPSQSYYVPPPPPIRAQLQPLPHPVIPPLIPRAESPQVRDVVPPRIPRPDSPPQLQPVIPPPPARPSPGYEGPVVPIVVPPPPAPVDINKPLDPRIYYRSRSREREGEYYGYGQEVATPAATPTPSPHDAAQNLSGPEQFVQFYWKTNDLLSELERLHVALRTVGACGPAIHAIKEMHVSFEKLRWMIGFNTNSLFPQPQDPRFKYLQTPNDAYLAEFSRIFDHVADALKLMERAFKDYQSAYYDNGIMFLLTCLHKRFKSESSKAALGKVRPDELKKRIQMLLGAFLIRAAEKLKKDLTKYCDTGVPVISSTQKARSTRYLNLTTIATFLSAVTATLLQISAGSTQGVLDVAVNTFLFTSLTFSIASAINSLLAMTWLKSIVREPNSYMPLWVSACINTGPMIALVVSAALFVVALSLFVFSSSQHLVTSTVTVSVAGLYTLCLLVLASWLLIEKWRFRHVAGSDGQKLRGGSLSMAIIDWIVLWPQRVNATLTGSGDPSSQLERGKYQGGPMSVPYFPGFSAQYKLFDAFSKNNFLSGTQPSTVGSRFGQSGGYGIGYGGGAYGPPPPAGRHGEDRPQGGEGGPHKRDYLGYAPTEYLEPLDEDHEYSHDPDEMPRLRRSRHRYSDDDDEPYIPEAPEPIFVPPPPVDSRTYETAQFLPRDEYTGDYEVINTSMSDSGVSSGNDATDARIYVPPMPGYPGQSIPSPMPVSYSEQVMVIPTDPPTYVVPPGSYVAYGTQPTIGPSAQAGNYAIYNPFPVPLVQAPVVPLLPALSGPPVIPPFPSGYGQPYTGGFGAESTPWIPPRPMRSSRDPRSSRDNDGPSSRSPSPPRVTTDLPDEHAPHGRTPYRRESSYSSPDQTRTQPPRQDTASSSVQVQPSMHDVPYGAASTRQSIYQSTGRYIPPRRSSSGWSQVRFNRPVVTEPQRRQSSGDQSSATRAQTSTSFLSQPFTAEPERVDTEQDIRDIDDYSRTNRNRATSSLDSVQQRYRHPRSFNRVEEADVPPPRDRRTTVETVSEINGDYMPLPGAVSDRHGREDAEHHLDPSSSEPGEAQDRPSVLPGRLSTITEVTRSSLTNDLRGSRDAEDSDSSGDSATTAPDTMFSDRKPSGSGS